ncbi:tetratricopeptide repeat protein [Acidiphilium sp. AL]|uniref:Tetratricopeptide repeat protein n=1 Tax=Acidiphilium iwatense TaxID=768198 RepID=A0ABS9DUZ8_9PROT|nr:MULTISPECIES: tetratricopeptide repeat protein [Acidiphilium]MCF3946537.1 tetratricopeptide repeat protein [Acidiphilium iwatense]MCU4160282.1 tetratricopeptide repeat protein [Acidiphilium sp. AL]
MTSLAAISSKHLAIVMFAALSLAACSAQPQPTPHLGSKTLNVARTALAGGNPQMALTITGAVLKSDPGNSEALIDRGDAYYLMNDCAQAEAAYQHALRTAPHAAGAELGLGRCTLARDPRAAAADFSRAIDDDPSNAATVNDLGVADAEASRFAAANAEFKKALALDPVLGAASVNLGMSLALGGNPGKAETILGPLARGPRATAKIRADYATALALADHSASARRILLTDMPEDEAQSMVAQLAKLGARIALPPPS